MIIGMGSFGSPFLFMKKLNLIVHLIASVAIANLLCYNPFLGICVLILYMAALYEGIV